MTLRQVSPLGMVISLLFPCFTSGIFAGETELRGHWPLHVETGKQALDQSPHKRHGTIEGGACWVKGKLDTALYFGGGNGLIEIPDAPDLDLTEALTVEAWVALESKGRTAPIVGKGTQSFANKHFQLFLGNYGSLWQFSVSDGKQPLSVSAGDAELNKWVHLAGTWQRSTSTACIYKNGIKVTQRKVAVGDFSTSAPLRIGGQTSGINGVISDVKLYARALPPEEIKASFDKGTARVRGKPADLFATRNKGKMAFKTVKEIACEGSYPGHIQGFDIDESHIYWSFTTTLVKTDRQGKLQTKVSVPHHHGGITVFADEIFAAFTPGRKIKVYSTKDLSFLREYEVPEVRGFPGGMDYHQGHFYIAEGTSSKIFPEVYKYDKNFKHVKTYTIPLHVNIGIQTIGRFNGAWWLGIYDPGHPTVMLDDDFQVLATRHDLSTAFGVKDWTTDTMMTGVSLSKNKKYSGKALLRQIVGK